jgi:hypothetical protein
LSPNPELAIRLALRTDDAADACDNARAALLRHLAGEPDALRDGLLAVARVQAFAAGMLREFGAAAAPLEVVSPAPSADSSVTSEAEGATT